MLRIIYNKGRIFHSAKKNRLRLRVPLCVLIYAAALLLCLLSLSAAQETSDIQKPADKQQAAADPQPQQEESADWPPSEKTADLEPAELDLEAAAPDLQAAAPDSEQGIDEARRRNLSPEELFYQPISLELRNMDVIEALKFLAAKGGLNIVATKNVSGRVTMTLENVPLKDIFDLMLRSNSLAYVKRGEIYNVMTEDEYKTIYGKNFYDIRQVKILRLQYAIPQQAFNMLEALKSDVGRVLVDEESGNVLIMDTPEKTVELEDSLKEFEKQNLVEVFSLKYARAKDVEEILKTRLDVKKVGSVKADERNNQIIVQTLPERMQEVAALVKSLDRQTKEVLIDAKIVKIKLSSRLDSGVEWEGIFSLASQSSGLRYLGSYPFSAVQAATDAWRSRSDVLSDVNGNVGSYPFSGTTTSYSGSTPAVVGEKMHLGMITGDQDFNLFMKLLNTIGETRILSNPKIVVVNNQEAKIHVGERQAYVTTTTTTGQTTSTIAEEVTFVDVGIQLSITPNINDDGYITMKVKPEISSVSSVLITPTNNRIPIIDTSLTETTVMVKDGNTVLIGGMRKEDKISSNEQFPILGKIPILNFLFKTGYDTIERTELLVMLTPHIISGDALTTGNERAFGENDAGGYRDYRPLSADKTVLPEGVPKGITPKTYRDYLSLKENADGELLIKGEKYDSR